MRPTSHQDIQICILGLLVLISIARLPIIPMTIAGSATQLKNGGVPFQPPPIDHLNYLQYSTPVLGVCSIILGFDWYLSCCELVFNRQPSIATKWAAPILSAVDLVVNIVLSQGVLHVSAYPTYKRCGDPCLGSMPRDPSPSLILVDDCNGDYTIDLPDCSFMIYAASSNGLRRFAAIIIVLALIMFLASTFAYLYAYCIKLRFYEPRSTVAKADGAGITSELTMSLPEGNCSRLYKLRRQAMNAEMYNGIDTATRPYRTAASLRGSQGSPHPISNANFHPAMLFWHTKINPYKEQDQDGSYFMLFICAAHLAFQVTRYYYTYASQSDKPHCGIACVFALVYPLLLPIDMFVEYYLIKTRTNLLQRIIGPIKLHHLGHAAGHLIICSWIVNIIAVLFAHMWFSEPDDGMFEGNNTTFKIMWGLLNSIIILGYIAGVVSQVPKWWRMVADMIFAG